MYIHYYKLPCDALLCLVCLGPLPTTITDFWRLVWQEKVKVIVMLTNVVEGGQRKCEQYWPAQEPQEYGPFTVTLADQQVFADYRQLLWALLGPPTYLLTLVLCSSAHMMPLTIE